MVGATRWFIVKPMDLRAIVNGLISALIAIAILFTVMKWAESQFDGLKALHTTGNLMTLFGGMVLVGVIISLYSTHRSVMKYLRMKLDDLY
jgi:cell division transport system permease protein